MKIINVDYYREWIEIELNGEIKVFNLYSTVENNIYIFYIGENYTIPYVFNDSKKEIYKSLE